MQTTWVLSANAGRARFFCESDPNEPLQEVEDMINDAVRERVMDAITTDKLGPTAASGSSHGIGGSGAPTKLYQPAQTPVQHEAEKFAKDIGKFLTEAHQAGRFQQLVVSASPQFLGELRANLDPSIKQLIKFEANKDYTHCNAQELREQLLAQMSKAH
ncbi:MAG: host attachment protein [Telluria sp.]